MVLTSWRAATQFLDTTSLVIGPLTVVRGRRLGRLTRLGVLVLEQEPAKGDGDQGRNENRQPDASLGSGL
jgi:hypothetical protein